MTSVAYNDKASLARVARVVAAVRTAMVAAGFKMAGRIKEAKLSGQVLNVRTGRLRRSINSAVTSSETGAELRVGTNVVYARPHEFGFKGRVTVAEHLRRSKAGNSITVSAHTRRMNLPERSFMRSTFREMKDEVRADIAAAIKGANSAQ